MYFEMSHNINWIFQDVSLTIYVVPMRYSVVYILGF
jgi:hypothetical protein